MAFNAPDPYDESSTPSTPSANYRRSTDTLPSTTPLGPPPFQSSAREPPSFTPAGAPTSSNIFGSSQFGRTGAFGGSTAARGSVAGRPPTAARSIFSTTLDANQKQEMARNNPFAMPSTSRGRTFEVPPSSPPGIIDISEDEEDDYDGDEEYDEDAEGEEMDETDKRNGDDVMDFGIPQDRGRGNGQFTSLDRELPTPMKSGGFPDLRSLARGTIAALPPVKLTEPDALILRTEDIMEKELYTGDETKKSSTIPSQATKAATKLRTLWGRYGRLDAEERLADDLGPKKDTSPVARANFMASLLLQLYQPSRDELPTPEPGHDFGRLSTNALILASSDRQVQMPRVLFDWLDLYHDPGARILDEVAEHEREGFATAPGFWDAIYSCAFRGRFKNVIELLEKGNFAAMDYTDRQLQQIQQTIDACLRLLQSCPAISDDNWDIAGPEWRVFRLRVEQAINGLRDAAEPGTRYDDLSTSRQTGYGQSSAFGGRSQLGLSETARQAESLLPYDIFEGLLNLYNILLGKHADLLQSAFSWLEATICLAAWWDGEEDSFSAPGRNLAASGRKSTTRARQARAVDLTPALAYRQRLSQCFEVALIENGEEDNGSVDETFDATSPLHIGLACILTGDISSAIDIIKSHSMTLASTITELANEAGWIPDARPSSRGNGALGMLSGFDNSDLMVLNYGQESAAAAKPARKDAILLQYADMLAKRPELRDQVVGDRAPGYAFAIRVLARVDDFEAAEAKVEKILEGTEFETDESVDVVLDVLVELEFRGGAVKLADRYATSLLDASLLNPNSPRWGPTLLYYARAAQPTKIKSIVDMLINMSIITSTAYPSPSQLDARLQSLLTSPQQALAGLAATDPQAATLLANSLAGYANLRRFYEFRDGVVGVDGGESDVDMLGGNGQKLVNGELVAERKRAAADCLLTAIASAGDCIRGGLYDPSVEKIMSVDVLLALLGEALVFVNRTPRLLTLPDLHALLRAIEDISTIGAKIYSSADSLLEQVIANYHDNLVASKSHPAAGKTHDTPAVFTRSTRSQAKTLSTASALSTASTSSGNINTTQPTPRSLLLRKSTSGLSGMSSFSLIGSSVLSGSGVLEDGSDSGSGVLIKVPETDGNGTDEGPERGWDWRKGIKRDAKGEDILGILRYGVAHEIARGWAEGEEVM